MARKKQPETPMWLNGKPYYCGVCGAGPREYVACEEPDCKLETIEEAQERAAHQTAQNGEGDV